MLKRVISLILCSALVFSIACFSAFAVESNNYDTCTHEWEQPIDHWYGIPIPGTDITFGVDVERCSKCGLYKHTADLLVLKSTYYSPLPPHLNGIVPSELITYWLNVWYNFCGKNATPTKAPSGIGRKDLPGYNNYDTGTPAVNPDGTYSGNFAMVYDGYVTPFKSTISRFTFDTKSDYSNGSSSSAGDGNVSAFAFYDDFPALSNVCVRTFYYFQAPVTGYYDITIPSISVSAKAKAYNGNYYSNFATYARWFLYVTRATSSAYYEPTSSSTNKADYRESYKLISGKYEPEFTTDSVTRTFYVTKGNIIQCGYTGRVGVSMSSTGQVWQSIAMQTAAPTIVCRSYADSSDNKLTNQANITINNNTWNGNIYTDNSTNLTYIYPPVYHHQREKRNRNQHF